MWVGVAIIEHSLSVLFNGLTLCIIALLLKRKSMVKMWGDSPPMVSLIVGSAVSAIANPVTNTQWIFVSAGLIPKSPNYTTFLHYPGTIAMSSGWLYDAATLGVCLQRLYILTHPLGNLKRANHVVVFVTSGMAILAMGIDLIVNIIFTSTDIDPATDDCFAASCMTSHVSSVSQRGRWFGFTLSLSVFITGAIFRVLLMKFSNRFPTNSTHKRMNRYTFCVLSLRFLMVFAPKAADDLIRSLFDIKLGSYIGPYGSAGGSLENFVSILAYFLMQRKTQTYVQQFK